MNRNKVNRDALWYVDSVWPLSNRNTNMNHFWWSRVIVVVGLVLEVVQVGYGVDLLYWCLV